MSRYKVLILNGSPHENGRTSAAAQAAKSALPEDCAVSEFNCYQTPVNPCIDCGHCSKNDGCVYHDLDDFYKELNGCDLLMIASPVYNIGFPAPLKAVIDRLQPYFTARFHKKDAVTLREKSAYVMLFAGGHREQVKELLSLSLKQTFSVLNVSRSRILYVEGTDGAPDLSPVFSTIERDMADILSEKE